MRTPSLLKKSLSISKYLYQDPVNMSLSFFGPDINRMNRPPNNFLPNQTNWRVDGLLVFVRFLGGDTGNLYRNVFFVKSQCQSPFPLSLESWHLLKVDRVFISFMFKSLNQVLYRILHKRQV
jgi:hypothetical protein